MAATIQAFDLCREIRGVGRHFESALGDAGARRCSAASVDRGMTPRNLSLALPYYLIEGFPFDGDVECARTMSRGNAFGAAHFLAQDRVLDGDDVASPRGCGFSDLCLVRFIREYSALFESGSVFWTHMERYLKEYSGSLAWERDVLWADGGGEAVEGGGLERALEMLGRKMSPLKCCIAAVSLLSESPELLAQGERLLVAYHSAYQLADDLRDLSEDAVRGRWSLPLRLIERCGRSERPLGELDQRELVRSAVATGAYASVTRLVCGGYEKAIELATGLDLPGLSDYIREALSAAVEMSNWVSRRVVAASDPASRPARRDDPVAPPDVCPHSFSVGSMRFVVDPASCLFFEADEVATDVLSWIRSGSRSAGRRVLEMNHGAGPVREAIRELAAVSPDTRVGASVPVARPPAGTPRNIVSLALDVTSACNLACDYCYLRDREAASVTTMSAGTARGCLDLLLDEASCDGAASLVFFGGEPLLRHELVLDIARRAREQAEAGGVRLGMHLTTNGTMLSPDVARSLNDAGVSVLVSIDGPAAAQDRHRRFPDGGGSHALVARNMERLPEGMSVSARVTLTPESPSLDQIVTHLQGMGFAAVHLSPVSGADVSVGLSRRLLREFEELAARELESVLGGARPFVGNFVRAMRALASGRPRTLPCGAGVRYLCAAPDGTLYLCHRFAGDPRFAVGTVFGGVDREAVRLQLQGLRREAAECSSCWARFLCGGPCLHDQSVGPRGGRPDPMRCELSKRVFELAMWMYASLPEGMKRGLHGPSDDDLPWPSAAV